MANTILKIAGCIIWFLTGILLTYKGAYMITIISQNIDSPLAKAIYWTGFILMWTLTIIITPLYGIISSYKDTE